LAGWRETRQPVIQPKKHHVIHDCNYSDYFVGVGADGWYIWQLDPYPSSSRPASDFAQGHLWQETGALRNCQSKTNFRSNMNMKTIIAVILVVSGIVVLAYSGITFNTPGKPIDFLGLHIETTNSHFVPPVVGAVALIGGIVLLFMRPRRV
jgi:hypothetical protein